MTTIAELEAKLAALQAEIAALKAQPDEIDWSDLKWIGRLVEVRDHADDPWAVRPCSGSKHGKCLTHGITANVAWDQARPYTGPTRPNWIEWRGGECPVPGEADVLIQFRSGAVAFVAGDTPCWDHAGSKGDIMRYSVVQP